MKSFQYLRPQTLAEALTILEQWGAQARPLLGGTDLMVRIQKDQAEVEAVVDLKRVKDIAASVEGEAGMTTVGSRVVLSDLIGNRQIQAHYPALVEAASTVGSIQIRNRATLTGNICNASPAADTVPPLMAYGAAVTVAGPAGLRRVSLEGFFLGPGKSVCGAAELVVAVHIPVPRRPYGCAFGRLARRRGVDLATVNMACAIDSDGITTFVFGAVGPKAIVARDETGDLADPDLGEAQRERLLRSLVEKTSPISDVRGGEEYRRAMLLTVGSSVLREAQQRRQAQGG